VIFFEEENADNKSIDPERPDESEKENKHSGTGQFAATPRCLRKSLYNDTQKAEFSFAESGQSSSYQRL
jgi:hypothetical protein